MLIHYLTKQGCGSCEKAIFLLRRLKNHYPYVTFRIRWIDNDPQFEQFLNKVPVVMYEGQVICEIKFDERLVRQLIEGIHNKQQ